MFSSIIFLAAYFLPESPRWLYVNNKQQASRAMLTKYHGEGNPDSEWVKLQLNEYEELLELDGADKRWWDYRALFKNKSTCYRLFCNVCISIFGQWAGNGEARLPNIPRILLLNINSCVILLHGQGFGHNWNPQWYWQGKYYSHQQLPTVLLGSIRCSSCRQSRSSPSSTLLQCRLLYHLACYDRIRSTLCPVHPSRIGAGNK